MTTKRRFSLVYLLVIFAEALLISLVLIYLAEYFGLPVVREAGGRVVSSALGLPNARAI